jgi:DHA1 family bicyclomycin/chloramphenicol resistance-like MFS transporter
MLLAQVILSAAMILVATAAAAGHVSNDLYFGAFVIWQASLFFQAGMTIGNLNAIAQEPMGHIAGMAASVISSVATVGGVALAVPVGLLFDGTPLPLSISIFLQAVLGLALMGFMVRVDARLTT